MRVLESDTGPQEEQAVCALDCRVPSPATTQGSNPPHSLSPNSSPSPSLSCSTSCAGPPTGAASQWLFPWRNLTLPPQQPSVGGGGTSRDFPLSVLGFWLDLVEFMCAVALSCPPNVLLQTSMTSGLYSLPNTSSTIIP